MYEHDQIDGHTEADAIDRIDAQRRFAALPERWQTVLRLRAEGWTHDEIAERLGVTKQRAWQIARDAERRISAICTQTATFPKEIGRDVQG